MSARYTLGLACWLAVWPAAADMPNIERGRLLYENHCVVCHTPNVHSRSRRIAIDPQELRRIVGNWQRQEKLRWSEQDVSDVVEFLRATRYKY